jgi:hypothetical protein
MGSGGGLWQGKNGRKTAGTQIQAVAQLPAEKLTSLSRVPHLRQERFLDNPEMARTSGKIRHAS